MTQSTVDESVSKALARAGKTVTTMPPSRVDESVPMDMTASSHHRFAVPEAAVSPLNSPGASRRRRAS